MPTRKFTDEQERDICCRYLAGETTIQLGQAFGASSSCISYILKRRRTPSRRGRIFTDKQERDICCRYLDGEGSEQLAAALGVAATTIINTLKRHGVERRAAEGFGDSVQHVLRLSGRYGYGWRGRFYVVGLGEGYSKAGLSFWPPTRYRKFRATGLPVSEHLEVTFRTREEAFFLEQAVLNATKGAAGHPVQLTGWAGAGEVRAMPAEDLVVIAEWLIEELEEHGVWSFAAKWVPMTAAQRATCQQRAAAPQTVHLQVA